MSDRIPVNDLRRHAATTRDAIAAAVANVIDGGWYVNGEHGAAFERDWAAYCRTSHAVGVANGTDALELALRALGVKRGCRVATTANAGFYGSTALHAIGAEPVFIDVDAETHLMDLGQLEPLLQRMHLSAIIVTHLYGRLHDMPRVRQMADRARVPVLEDCAQAHGARRRDYGAGQLGHAAAFSFYPTKNLGAIGDAGAVVTSDAVIAESVRRLREYGWKSKYRVALGAGRNSRLDDIQAAVLSAKLPHLEGWNQRRRSIATRYSQLINHPQVKTPIVRDEDYVAHLYVIACNARDGLASHLADLGISTDIHYPVPDHLQISAGRNGDDPHLPITEKLAATVLTLPCFPELTDPEVDRVIAAINSW